MEDLSIETANSLEERKAAFEQKFSVVCTFLLDPGGVTVQGPVQLLGCAAWGLIAALTRPPSSVRKFCGSS
jgi:hypothetical protein